MRNYTLYHDGIETIEPDEQETHAKIIEVMTDGMNLTHHKYGKGVRISHASAQALVRGELTVLDDLPPELAQGLFAKPAAYPALVRLSHAPGELVDDSKVSTPRGIAIKIFNVEGDHIAPFQDIATQDFVCDTGSKEFINSNAKTFLQAFRPNAEIAPKLSDTVKGVVSDVARGTNAVLHAVGYNSAKLDFYGHPKFHPMAEAYYSQTAYRYGDYVAKFAVIPANPALEALRGQKFDPQNYDALREETVAFFRDHPAEFNIAVQLNTNLDKMPIEDATVKWSEDESPYRKVARLVLPAQSAYDPAKEQQMDTNLSFSPAHALAAHRPLGSVNRARLAAYTAMSTLRRQMNHGTTTEPASIEQIPA